MKKYLLGETTPAPGMGLPVLFTIVCIFGVVTTISTLKAQVTSIGQSTNAANAEPATLSTDNNDALTAEMIIAKAKAAYAALQSYSDTETVLLQSQISQSQTSSSPPTMNSNTSTTTNLKIRLQRPGLYRIVWQGSIASGVAWSDGTGDFLKTAFLGTTTKKQKQKRTNRQEVLTGILVYAGGAGDAIPNTFFGDKFGPSNFSLISMLPGGKYQRQKDEMAGGIDCYVILNVGKAPGTKLSSTLWIGKEDNLIHQIKTTSGSSDEPITDSDFKEMLTSQGQPVTPEAIAKVRNEFASAQALANKMANGMKTKVETETTESHTDIVTNKIFTPADFMPEPH